MNNVLELQKVCKRLNAFALEDVSFALPKGSIMGFVGENGAGKSTTIKLILNLLHLDSGSIHIFGQDYLANESHIKDEIGVVFDESNFPEYMKPGDVDLVLRNIYSRWDSQVFNGYIEQFSLPRDKTIKTYSRGMKMKLAIAAALSHNARLLLLDEATSGLDPIVRDEILDVFLAFIQDEERGILVSSHIVDDLEKVADYITFIHEGRIVLSEPVFELREQYAMLRCSKQDLQSLSRTAVKGYRENAFGVDALVLRAQAPGHLPLESASVEDIMLYTIRGNKR